MVSWIFGEQMIVYYISIFRDTFWPDGTRAVLSNVRTEAERQETRDQAQKKLLESVPGTWNPPKYCGGTIRHAKEPPNYCNVTSSRTVFCARLMCTRELRKLWKEVTYTRTFWIFSWFQLSKGSAQSHYPRCRICVTSEISLLLITPQVNRTPTWWLMAPFEQMGKCLCVCVHYSDLNFLIFLPQIHHTHETHRYACACTHTNISHPTCITVNTQTKTFKSVHLCLHLFDLNWSNNRNHWKQLLSPGLALH